MSDPICDEWNRPPLMLTVQDAARVVHNGTDRPTDCRQVDRASPSQPSRLALIRSDEERAKAADLSSRICLPLARCHRRVLHGSLSAPASRPHEGTFKRRVS